MKITVISVGKIKEKYLKDAIAEYSKRLGRYCKLEIIEVQDEKTPDQASETVDGQIRDKEAERILKYIRDDMYVITLEIGGKMLSSEDRQSGHPGEKPSCFRNRRIHRPGKEGLSALRLCFKLFQDDVPASADAGDTAGTGVPWIPDHQWRAVS